MQTSERMNDAVAEPVVYTLNRYVVGGFCRSAPRAPHRRKPGRPRLQLVASRLRPPRPNAPARAAPRCQRAPNRFYMYGVIARLAMLAAGSGWKATNPDAEVYD